MFGLSSTNLRHIVVKTVLDMNHQWPFHSDRFLHFFAWCFKESSHWAETIFWLLRAFPWFVCTVFPVSQERCHNSWSRAVVHSSLVDCAALLQSKEALGRHPLSTGYGTSTSTSALTSMLTSVSTSPCTGHQHYTFQDSCFWAANLYWHLSTISSAVTTEIGASEWGLAT